jgi:hypothetical protein
MYCTIIQATWERVGHAPALICEDGILREPSQWLQELAKDGKSQSLLEMYAYGLQRYYDFWRHYSIAFKGDDLLRAFWKAMRLGDANLGWERLKQKTAEGYLTGVNLFTDWLSDRNGTENPNPLRDEKAPWFVLLALYDRRRKTDLLFHLYHNTKVLNPGHYEWFGLKLEAGSLISPERNDKVFLDKSEVEVIQSTLRRAKEAAIDVAKE